MSKNNVTKVDFQNKRVKHFVDEPKVSRDEVAEAIDTLKTFLDEDFYKKVGDYTDIEQVVLHEIEDGDEDFLAENAVDILLNLKDVRNTRREAKQCLEIQKKISSKLKKADVNTTHNELVKKPKQNWGSSEQYFNNKLKRTKADKELMAKGLFSNMLNIKEEEKEESI